MSVDFMTKAIELAQLATEYETKGDYKEALDNYLKAIERFNCAMKYEKMDIRRNTIKAKTLELMDRAEQIKEMLTNNGGNNPGSGGTAQETKGKKQGGDGTDEDSKLKSSLMESIVGEKPDVKWSDIAGLEAAKEALREAVILPITFPQLFVGKRKPWRGILMYGPPGTGKTYLAKACATEIKSTFFSITCADIMSKWVGDSEKLVRNLFKLAREHKPSIIFIDEIDSLCSTRGQGGENDSSSRVKTEFLVQMQGVGHDDTGVLVLAATNLPWALDSAVRRRFEKRIEIGLPKAPARTMAYKIHLGNTPHRLTDEDFQKLGAMSDMYSCHDINVVVRNAIMEPVRTLQLATHFKEVPGPDPDNPEVTIPNRLVPCSPGDPAGKEMSLLEIPTPKLVMPPEVTMEDFLLAFASAKPSVSEADITEHKRFTAQFGQEG